MYFDDLKLGMTVETEPVVIEKEKMMAGKRSGVIFHLYKPSTDNQYKNWIVIGDMPIAYCESSNSSYNKFIFLVSRHKIL